jgi:hypothetical protein
MKANLRRRLKILEAARGKTPLAMAHLQAQLLTISLMTDEELEAAVNEAEKMIEISSSKNIEEICKLPLLRFVCLSDLEIEWVRHEAEYRCHAVSRDKA